MAPPKKQKREYTPGEFVWVKIKGYPIWPGQVEDLKNVKNEDVIKKKRKNAVLVKFLDDTYTWSVHEDIKPLEKETFEDYVISSNHKNYKQWKDAFEKCCKEAGIDDAAVEQALNSSKDRKKKREREENTEGENPKKKKKTQSASPSRKSSSPSPKRTARKASLGGEKKKNSQSSPKPKSKKETKNTPRKSAGKRNALNPPLEGNANLLREFANLLTQYEKDDDSQKLHQLLKVIENFSVPDISVLQDAKIGKLIKKLMKSKDDKVKLVSTRIYNYYDSLILESVESKNKKEAKKEDNNEENKEEGVEKKEDINNNDEEGKETTSEVAPKSEPEEEKTEAKESEEDKMVTEAEAKPSESQESTSSIIEQSQ